MHPLIIQRVATAAAMPLVAAGGWAGYSYYGPSYPPAPVSVSQQVCTTFTTDLYYGRQAPDVLSLQQFLAGRGYLAASPTGYFGPATRMAVSRFQADYGIPISGYADGQTRTRIEQVACAHYSQASNGTYAYSDSRTCGPYDPGCGGAPSYSYSAPSSSYGCTSYYDRSCYVNGTYVGPSYGGGSTYNGPGDTCYLSNGTWYGDCGQEGYRSSSSYSSAYPYTNDYSCYYDRACLARMQGRDY